MVRAQQMPYRCRPAHQVGGRGHENAEVTGVCVWAHVGHAQKPAPVVLELQTPWIILEVAAKDAFRVGT